MRVYPQRMPYMQVNAVNLEQEILKAKETLGSSLIQGLDLKITDWHIPALSEAKSLSTCIDHTLLKPEATAADIVKLCEEAKAHFFFSVCVNTYWVKLAKKQVEGTSVRVATTVGFPLGAMPATVKANETATAIDDGADEIDMVINIGALKSKDYQAVLEDLLAVRKQCESKTLKVILETGILSTQEIIIGSMLSKVARADFLKTSTGFVSAGATSDSVSLLRRIAGDKMGVKASGGIRTTEIAKKMIEAGANRLGCSASLAIVGAGESVGTY